MLSRFGVAEFRLALGTAEAIVYPTGALGFCREDVVERRPCAILFYPPCDGGTGATRHRACRAHAAGALPV